MMKIMALVIMTWCACSITGAYGSNTEKNFTSPSIRFVESQGLRCELTEKECEHGEFVGHCTYQVDCAGMTPSAFEFIQCEQSCTSPLTDRILKRTYFQVREISYVMTFVIAEETYHLRNVIGCSCALTPKGYRLKERVRLDKARR